MNIVIGDFFISLLIVIIAIKFLIYESYKNGAIIVLTLFILTSLFINLNKYVISIALFLIGVITLIIYIMKEHPSIENPILFWLMFSISIIVLGSLLLFKRLIINMLNYTGPTGEKGKIGLLGKEGISYILNNYQNRCYDILLNESEKTFANILVFNKDLDSNYLEKNSLIENMYFKQKLKQISRSYQFLNYVYNGKITEHVNSSKCPCPIKSGENKGSLEDHQCRFRDDTKTRICENNNNDKECLIDNNCLSLEQRNYFTAEKKYNT